LRDQSIVVIFPERRFCGFQSRRADGAGNALTKS